jgi:PadR family transcriptional regulator, regulatory protein PadR
MARNDGELLRGTFDMMILKALSLGDIHGWGIAERIERLSGQAFDVQQGVVYPALQRLLRRGLVTAEWRTTENNRRARYYRLTASGRRELIEETESWQRAAAGIARLLRAIPEAV